MTWRDVEPAKHPFDPSRALDAVRAVVASPDPESGRPRGLWSDNSIAQGLAEHYGTWAFGWYTAMQLYPDSGTVIRELPPCGLGARDLDQQARRYTDALLQWRGWLEELAAAFAPFVPGPDSDAATRRQLRESGVAALVTLVVERTQAGELWLGTCAQALTWFLEATGVPVAEAEELVDDIVDGEFASWVAPDAEAIGRARKAVGEHRA
ncbi:hypothetical protein V2W30_14455 [Streptomyces sp. Q6]|uniref:Uncharacterized protein n=1 Tax=Streptomyces citrinus TaxID=3118173 RepID=A0ACD5AC14_9ACTN